MMEEPSLVRYIDLHCERLQDGLLGEPLNVLSNLLFFFVAFYLWKRLDGSPVKSTFFLRFLAVCVAFVGMGSIFFHMTATPLGALLDVTPIAVFAIILIYKFARIPFGLSRIHSLMAIAAFAIINVAFKFTFPIAPDGHVSLIPSAIILGILCLNMYHRDNPSKVIFLRATLISYLAIFFRALDTMMNKSGVCEHFPIGTHFLWHALMAWFIFILVEELILRRLTEISHKEKLLRNLRKKKGSMRLRRRRS